VADGDSAQDNDCWFRAIIDSRWINHDGTLAEQALKALNAIAPPTIPRGWQHELSGRLLSLANDVAQEGIAFVEKIRSAQIANSGKPRKTLASAGIAYSAPSNLRPQILAHIQSDVVHTPINPPDPYEDSAHSDFVTYQSTDDDLDAIRTELQDRLRTLRPNGIANLTTLCQAAALPKAEPSPSVKATTASGLGTDPVRIVEPSTSDES
jgi:hypothetical protein